MDRRNVFVLENEHGTQLQRDDRPLEPGHYYIVADDGVAVLLNNEPVLTRTYSLATGTRVAAFMQSLRERDGGCMISGQPALYGDFVGFQGAHIFPLAYEGHWKQHGFSRWISILPEKGGAINSPQNGLLLRADIHLLFDAHIFAINPDDGYKVIWFREHGAYGHGADVLPRSTLDHPHRPADELLRWHFRQTVLANMKAAAEPIFEHDFPPGSDMLEDIRTGPKAAERMEAELFGRLALHMDITKLESSDEENGQDDDDASRDDKGGRF